MAHLSKVFQKRQVDIPNRSGFDLSFENLLTMKCGTLTPVLCEEVLPGETFSLGQMTQVQLPPMATDFYGRVDMRMEAFFVPNRIVWGGWEDFWTQPESSPFGDGVSNKPTQVPSARLTSSAMVKTVFTRGGLADYLGMKADFIAGSTPTEQVIPNILPFLAYHKICDDWYRNSKVTKPYFIRPAGGGVVQSYATFMPYLRNSAQLNTATSAAINLNDGTSLFALRQRPWAKDYYTTATYYPQGSENPSSVELVTSSTTGTFTIPQLRSANVLQRWMERNNIAGFRYGDQIKAQYGVLPADAVLDRAMFLGSTKFGIYNKSVYQTSAEQESQATTSNPFGGVASKYATSNGFGQDSLIDNFTATEHGYIIVIASIVPHAYYSTGIRRQLLHSKVGDFAIPLLQGVGDQAIYLTELHGQMTSGGTGEGVFGYTVENAEYKYHDDEVHGLLCDGQSLESFCLQRSFNAGQAIPLSTSFTEIPTNFMDQVTASSSDMSNYGAWADIYFSFKRISPLSEYVIPTLGDLTNTHKESIPVGGRQL